MTVLMTRRGEIPNIAKEVSASDLEIGSIVKLPFYTSDSDSDNDGYTEFIVVHQGNPNSSVYDSSCDGTWLWCKTPMVCMMFDDDTMTNDYENSDVHAWLNNNNNFYNLTSDVRASIKKAKIPYYYGVDNSKNAACNATLRNGSNGLLCELGFFLLSRTEITGRGYTESYAPCGEPLDYFEYESNYEYGSDEYNEARSRRRNGHHQWLRTPFGYNDEPASGRLDEIYMMHYVSPMGSSAIAGEGDITPTNDYYAVCPACVINSTAKFDSETGILITA